MSQGGSFYLYEGVFIQIYSVNPSSMYQGGIAQTSSMKFQAAEWLINQIQMYSIDLKTNSVKNMKVGSILFYKNM
jgi:hypothetical protein